MMWFDDGTGGWGYAVMTISMVVVWGLLIAGVILLVRYLTRTERPPTAPPVDRPPSPEQVLAERFARGEIDADEYRRRLEILRAAGSPVTRS